MEELIGKIALGLIVPSIIGIIKLYTDHAVLKANHNSLQLELNEAKNEAKEDYKALRQEIKDDNKRIEDLFEKRFEKLEKLIESYFTWTKEHQK